jgi:hypothetical protein
MRDLSFITSEPGVDSSPDLPADCKQRSDCNAWAVLLHTSEALLRPIRNHRAVQRGIRKRTDIFSPNDTLFHFSDLHFYVILP